MIKFIKFNYYNYKKNLQDKLYNIKLHYLLNICNLEINFQNFRNLTLIFIKFSKIVFKFLNSET